MAKSIRSKWKRKMRAVKRERYGKKELERLKSILGINDGPSSSDTQMTEVSEVATVTNKEEILKRAEEKEKQRKKEDDEDANMEVDVEGRRFNAKTFKDQNGTYPVWMHQRKIRKAKKAMGKGKHKKGKAKRKKWGVVLYLVNCQR